MVPGWWATTREGNPGPGLVGIIQRGANLLLRLQECANSEMGQYRSGGSAWDEYSRPRLLEGLGDNFTF